MSAPRPAPRTPQSDYLLQLGIRLLKPYAALPTARAAMVTGSAAEGVSDFHSDLDMTMGYEAAYALESLVGDVVTLVERECPDIETLAVRRRLGYRRPAWTSRAG
jgi:hypothetical protein